MSEVREQQIDMLIRFFNLHAETRFKLNVPQNREAVASAIAKANDNIVELKNFVRDWCEKRKNEAKFLVDCFYSFYGEAKTVMEVKDDEVKTEMPKEKEADSDMGIALKVLCNTISGVVSQTKQSEIESRIMQGVEDKVRDFIKNEYGSIERKITTVVDGKRAKLDGVHKHALKQNVGAGVKLEFKCQSCKEINEFELNGGALKNV